MNKTRRYFSGPEKVAILKRHLLEETPVSDLCDELSWASAQSVLSLAEGVLRERPRCLPERSQVQGPQGYAKQRKIEQLEARLQRKNEVLPERMQEHTRLRKELGEP